MADVNVNYDMISKVAAELTAARATFIPEFQKLQGTVDTLLQADGGFWMDQTAPAIQAQYDQFSASLHLMAQNLGSFGDMFNGFVQNMYSMDYTMAWNVNHPQQAGNQQATNQIMPPPPPFQPPGQFVTGGGS